MRIIGFPNPVNEVAARLVAAGVAATALVALATGWHWLLIPLAYGFVARALTGPTLSPLGQLVTRAIVPRLPAAARPVPGPPKRFAQGMGATITVLGVILDPVLGFSRAGGVLLALILVAATLESVFALCIGCRVFAVLMRAGLVPEDVCEACANIGLRSAGAAPH